MIVFQLKKLPPSLLMMKLITIDDVVIEFMENNRIFISELVAISYYGSKLILEDNVGSIANGESITIPEMGRRIENRNLEAYKSFSCDKDLATYVHRICNAFANLLARVGTDATKYKNGIKAVPYLVVLSKDRNSTWYRVHD